MADEGTITQPVAEGATSTKPAVEPVFDRSALESKVSKSLAALRDTEEPQEAAEPVAADPGTEAVKGGAEPAEAIEDAQPALPGDEDDAEEDEPENGDAVGEQPPAEKKPAGPTLPAAYRRSLKAYDWTDEEIDSAFAQNPAGFTVTAQKLHTNRNAELSRWAEMGRAARTQPNAEQGAPAGGEKKTPAKVDAKGIKPLDIDAMVEKYGNEELVREIAGPVQAALEQINTLLPDLMLGVRSIQESRQQTLSRQIDEFFGGKELVPFTEFYGKDSASLTDATIQNRNKVLEMADALIAGAAQQGRQLNINEALTLAHDSVSGGFKTEATRRQLKATVQKRGASITLRPSSKGAKPNTGPAKTAGELESRTRSRLAAVFG